MKLGLGIVDTNWQGGPPRMGPLLGDVVEAAEEAGFDTISVADHVWPHPIIGGPLGNHVEAYTTLGFIAADTKRVRLMAWPRGPVPAGRPTREDRNDARRPVG